MSHHGKTRVLVVDDDDIFRRLVLFLFETSDLTVVGVAANGRAALDAVEGLQPDVVLMDYQMPVMDGITAAQHLRQMPRSPRVVLFTSDDLERVRPEAQAAGIDAVLSKACPFAVLQQTLTQVAHRNGVAA